jgi:hypothetical protein
VVWLDRIADDDDRHRLTIHGKKDGRFAFALTRRRKCFERGEIFDALLTQEICFADHHRFAIHLAADTRCRR